MNMLFRCDRCSREINAPPALAGKPAACPFCRTIVRVPQGPLIAPDEIRDFIENELPPAAPEELVPAAAFRSLPPELPRQPVPATKSSADLSASGPQLPAISVKSGMGNLIQQTVSAKQAPTSKPHLDDPAAVWYVRPESGGQFGPASNSLLQKWKEDGRVSADAWLWRGGWDDWKPASVVFPELLDADFAELAEAVREKKGNDPVDSRINWVRRRRAQSTWLTVSLILGSLLAIGLVIATLIYFGRDAAN